MRVVASMHGVAAITLACASFVGTGSAYVTFTRPAHQLVQSQQPYIARHLQQRHVRKHATTMRVTPVQHTSPEVAQVARVTRERQEMQAMRALEEEYWKSLDGDDLHIARKQALGIELMRQGQLDAALDAFDAALNLG